MGFALASILALLTVLWFQRHLYPYMKLFLGTDDGAFLSTLVASSAAYYGFFKAQVDERVKGLLALLERPGAPKILGTGIIAMAALLLATSSILVTLDGHAIDREFDLSIQKEGQQLAGPITISRKNPLFFRLGFDLPGTIALQLSKPFGYAREARRFGLGSALRVGVPTDFRPKELHILRLVPGWGVVEPLLGVDSEEKTKYELWIRVGKGKLYKAPLRKQPIYIGASAQELEAAEKRETTEWWKRLPRTLGGSEKESQDSLLEQLAESRPLYFSTEDLAPREVVRVDLAFFDVGPPEVHTLGSYTVFDNPSIQTIFLQDR